MVASSGRRVAPGPPVSLGMSARRAGRPAPDAGRLRARGRGPVSESRPNRSIRREVPTIPDPWHPPCSSPRRCAQDSRGAGRSGVESLPGFEGLIGRSAGMQALFDRIRRVAPYDVPVLILGETGTGKELVAAALHRLSRRRSARFEAVNCGALTRELLRSELFGHERGAFTGAIDRRPGLLREADGGTVFLDEVAELAPDAQAMLLRFLGDGEVRAVGASRAGHVDVRLIAATHRDLRDGGRRGSLPRGPLLPPAARRPHRAAAARADRGPAAPRRAHPPPGRRAPRAPDRRGDRGRVGSPRGLPLARERPRAGGGARGGDDPPRPRRAPRRGPRAAGAGGRAPAGIGGRPDCPRRAPAPRRRAAGSRSSWGLRTPACRPGELARAAGVGLSLARRELGALVAAGELRRTGRGRAIRYVRP